MSFASMGAKVLKEMFTEGVEETTQALGKVSSSVTVNPQRFDPKLLEEEVNPSLVQRPTK